MEFTLEVKLRSIPRDPRNTLIVACPEPSLASVVAIEYVIDALKMEELGSIRIRELAPMITVINGVAKLPYRLFYKREYALVTIRQHIPIPPDVYRDFISRILEWAEENGINRVICLTAIPAIGEKESEDVFFVTEEDHVEEFKALGFIPVKEATIAGAEAVFLDAVLSKNIVGALILAESKVLTAIRRLLESGKIATHKDILYILNQTVGQFGPDVTAAIKLVKAISKLINAEIPLDNLKEHASKYSFLIEKNLEAYLKPAKEEHIPIIY